MNRSTQDGLMQQHAERDCWSGAGEATPMMGAWLEQAQAADRGAEARMAWLLRTIEAEIIPRLLLAHQSARPEFAPGPVDAPSIGRDQVVELAGLALADPPHAAHDYVQARRAEGVSLDVIYLYLLAPAASHLGEMWEADLCDFTQVTLGLWRLQQVLHELSPAFQNDAAFVAHRRRALLAPAPGSQHTLGLLMVAEFFRRAGWEVWSEPSASMAELTSAVRAEWFDVVGLSAGVECQVRSLSSVIDTLRKASRNKTIGVMVGGPIFASRPELATAVGADATAVDAPQAIALAESLVNSRSAPY